MSCFLAGPQATNSFFMAADPFHWPNIIKASILKIHVMFGKRLPGRARRKLARLARRKPELREERGMGGLVVEELRCHSNIPEKASLPDNSSLAKHILQKHPSW